MGWMQALARASCSTTIPACCCVVVCILKRPLEGAAQPDPALALHLHPWCLQEEWEEEFGKYKSTPEYLRTNQGMTVDEFKFIYFWEWGHRMWGRALGESVGREVGRVVRWGARMGEQNAASCLDLPAGQPANAFSYLLPAFHAFPPELPTPCPASAPCPACRVCGGPARRRLCQPGDGQPPAGAPPVAAVPYGRHAGTGGLVDGAQRPQGECIVHRALHSPNPSPAAGLVCCVLAAVCSVCLPAPSGSISKCQVGAAKQHANRPYALPRLLCSKTPHVCHVCRTLAGARGRRRAAG
jgi:hypothetical protein